MLTDAQKAALLPVTRTLQIIVAALASGLAMFFVVVVFIASAGQKGVGAGSLLITYVAIGAAFFAMSVALVLPGVIAGKQRQAIASGKAALTSQLRHALPPSAEFRDLGSLVVAYHTRVIIYGTLLEGAGFFNLVAYMIERQTASLVIASFLLLMILSQFPTTSRLENWIENEMRTIDQLRQLGPSNA
jgi:hypothetical protein